MSKPAKKSKTTFLGRLLGGAGPSAASLAEDKARLEAFLGAFPGEYCGWAGDGSVAYSAGFCGILGLDQIEGLHDIQSCLQGADAATLENLFGRLQAQGLKFSTLLTAQNGEHAYQFSGARGQDISGQDHFNVLWVEDKTADHSASARKQEEEASQNDRLQLLENSFETMPWPAWIRGHDGHISWCNNAYAKALDSDAPTIIKEQRELLPPPRKKKGEKAKPGSLELGKLAIETAQEQSTQAHLIIGGKRLYMQFRETPLPCKRMTLGLAEDITREEELQGELDRYQATNRELLGQLSTAIGLYNSDQQLEFYNSAFARLWGLEEGWLNKKPRLADIMEKLRERRRLPEQADFRSFKDSWLGMFTALIEPHEEMLYLPGGEALRMLAVPQSTGGLMMTFEDVTSNLELESSYNTLIAVQKETLDNLGEGVAVYGPDGRLKLWNPAFSRLWDLNPEDLDGEPHISRVTEKMKGFFKPEEWEERQAELIGKALDRIMHEGRHTRMNDTQINYTTVPLPDGGVLVTYSDVTDSVRFENALREKNAALEAAERLKMDFLANVSYQLRTPLNAIMGFNEILDQEYFGPLNARQKEYVHDMGQSSQRLLGLINDILDLSTIEAGYMILHKEPVKLRDLMDNIEDLMKDWARKQRLKFTIKCPANIGELEADERRLKQALINLIRNAINFTPSGGEIIVGAARKKDGIEFTVSDNGIGISRENQMRIFKPFETAQRGEISAQPSSAAPAPDPQDKALGRGGAGLGLSLVKNIVAMHEGTIDLDSESNKGTSVRVFLPFPQKTKVDVTKMKKDVTAPTYRDA